MTKALLQHLADRHFDPSRYTVFFGDDATCKILLWQLDGRCAGYQQYRPGATKDCRNDPKEGRYYTWLGGHKKERNNSAFGLETLDYSPGLCFVTEGIFDACRFHNAGYSALATLSNDPKHLRQALWLLGQTRCMVAVCDNDAAGRKLARSCHRSVVTPGTKDCGDMTEEEFRDFLAAVLGDVV